MSAEDKKCPDCGGPMKSIKIIDKRKAGGDPSDLEYTVPEKKRSIWTGLLPN